MSTSTVTNNSSASAANNSSASAASSGDTIAANGTNISNLFTTLLVAQIRNQDPLSPTDPSQFVNQLTQLSQTETLQTMAKQGATTTSLLASLQALSLGNQVGSVLQVEVSNVTLGHQPVQTHYTASTASSKTELVLTGSDGKETRIAMGASSIGENDFVLDPVAQGLAPGRYDVHVENESGQSFPLDVEATLTGLRMTGGGGAALQFGSLGEYDPAAIIKFKGRTANPS